MQLYQTTCATAVFVTLLAGSVNAHGPVPRPWQITPLATMSACQAGTESDAIAPYCEALLESFAKELQACKMALADTSTGAPPVDDGICQNQAAATAAAHVVY